jgi:hypothetical protein
MLPPPTVLVSPIKPLDNGQEVKKKKNYFYREIDDISAIGFDFQF